MTEPQRATHQFPRLAILLAVLLLVSALIDLATKRPSFTTTQDFAFYVVPAAVAALLVGGLRVRLPAAVRLGALILLALATRLPLHAWATRFGTVNDLILLFLPVWLVLAFLGTGRYRWSVSQLVGATLLIAALWRPLHLGLLDLTAITTATGTLPALGRTTLYRSILLDALRTLLIPLVGLFLLANRMPWVQRVPPQRSEASDALRLAQATPRRTLGRDLARGPIVLVLSFFTALAL